MYILSIIAVFALFLLYCIWVVELRFLFLPWFFDFPSLVVIFLSPIPFLMLNGLLKDFGNAVLIARKKKAAESLTELKRAGEAVKLAKNTILGFAVFIAFVQAVLALHMYDDPTSVGYLLDPIIISIVYGMAGVLILQPLQMTLKLRILEFEEKKQIEETES